MTVDCVSFLFNQSGMCNVFTRSLPYGWVSLTQTLPGQRPLDRHLPGQRPPPCEQNYRHVSKHYLSATSSVGGKYASCFIDPTDIEKTHCTERLFLTDYETITLGKPDAETDPWRHTMFCGRVLPNVGMPPFIIEGKSQKLFL